MEEKWVPVRGFESDYLVSSLGKVCRISVGGNGQSGKILKPWNNSRSLYPTVVIMANGNKRRAYVHHLVLESFVGLRPEGFQCNHKNGNRRDNRLTNLEWCSPSANLKHSYDILGRKRPVGFPHVDASLRPRGERHGMATLSEKIVREMREYKRKNVSASCQKIADIFSSKKGTVIDILSRKNWRHVV